MTHPFDLEALQQRLAQHGPDASPISRLRDLVKQSLDDLPMPGRGFTLQRWQALSSVAAHDLSLAKLYEGHTDALAILREIGSDSPWTSGSVWGTWASEAPDGRAQLLTAGSQQGVLDGGKCWCSGANDVSHGLLTAWLEDGAGPQLVSLQMDQAGIEIETGHWKAVGMANSQSLDLRFSGAAVQLVGQVGDYLSRPGFWHGGAGVAACWYGGATALARTLREAVRAMPDQRQAGFRLAALGRVDMLLQQTASLLREAAEWIDAHPLADARLIALRTRLSAERCATAVLDVVGQVLGAAPYCRDERFARMAADLPVFIRQSHAERDQAALGERIAAGPGTVWAL